MDWKNIYWNEMVMLKDNLNYADNYIKFFNIGDKTINIIITFSTSVTIASWGIWKNFSSVWGCILGLAQLFVAIKPFLSFNTTVKNCREYYSNASIVFKDFENNFYDVWEGKLTDKEIDDKLCGFRTKIAKIESDFFKKSDMHEFKWMFKLGRKKTILYMNKYRG